MLGVLASMWYWCWTANANGSDNPCPSGSHVDAEKVNSSVFCWMAAQKAIRAVRRRTGTMCSIIKEEIEATS